MANLLNCCIEGNIERVKNILENENVDINFQNSYGSTVLSVASVKGEIKIVKYLLTYEKENVNPNLQNIHGENPLICASCRGYTEIVKLLLNYEKNVVNPNLQDEDGYTVLDLVYRKNHIEIIKLLENYISFRKNIERFKSPYNILLSILIRERCKHTSHIPNEIILLIRDYGKIMCGRETFI